MSTFVGATDGADAFITPTAGGRFSVSLTLTDTAGARATTTSAIDVPGPPPSTGSASASTGGGSLGTTWLILLLGAVLTLARRRA